MSRSRAGIFMIRNEVNRKMLIGASRKVFEALSRCEHELKHRTHPNRDLMDDWLTYGAERFTFRIIDTVRKAGDSPADSTGELTTLLDIWLQEYEPYGGRGYNHRGERLVV